MEKILNEEVTIQVKHNPWKRFGVFYILTALIILLGFIIYETGVYKLSHLLMTLFVCLILLAIPYIMVLGSRKMIFARNKSIIYGVCFLMSLYILPYFIIGVMNYGSDFFDYLNDIEITIIISLFQGYGLLCSGIIILIINRKRKKHAGLT